MSQDQMNQAAEISRFVLENGRVESDGEGNLNLESLRTEVEFECSERNLPDCDEIAEAAVKLAK
jgi:hypothetical protein